MTAVPEDTGYPLTWFINEDFVRNMYECVVCLEVVKDPVQVRDCGHQFCRHCLDNVLQLQAQCPSCRKEISEEMVFTDNAARRAIGQLEVKCPSNGCEWDGDLNSLLEEHTVKCPLFVVNCINVGCKMQVMQRELKVHLTQCQHRTVVCKLCGNQYVFTHKTEHFSACPCVRVECVNRCSARNIPRNEMEKHLDTVCPKTLIKCNHLEIGCEYECVRQKMEEHLHKATKEHLELSTLELSRLKKKINLQSIKHNKEMRELTAKVTPITPPPMIITDFKRKLSEAKENRLDGIEGDTFYTSPHGYKLRMSIRLNETREEHKDHMGVYINVMKSDHDAILSWPFNKKCTFTLIDQQDNEEERKDVVRLLFPDGQENFTRPKDQENPAYGLPSFVSHATLPTRKYIKDDTVFVTLSIEP